MPGIPQWNRNVEVTANPLESVISVDVSTNVSIPAGGNVIVSIFAPNGYVGESELLSLYYPPLVGSTTGTKRMNVYATNGLFGVLDLTGNHNTTQAYAYGAISGTTTAIPSDPIAQQMAQSGISFDEYNPITVRVMNSSDAVDNVQKTIRLWGRKRKILS